VLVWLKLAFLKILAPSNSKDLKPASTKLQISFSFLATFDMWFVSAWNDASFY
jgi:hypothetical protein